ncbi:hypothetical protein FRB91_009051 [Serendipita sp. 411]|nr:hypothetical protein FRB91_009051 [Serendipita sp. 411]
MPITLGRHWTRSTADDWCVSIDGNEVLEFCYVCYEEKKQKVAVEPLRTSRNQGRLYQRCSSGDHGLFLKDLNRGSPLVVQTGLSPPRIPPLPNRGTVYINGKPKKKCAEDDCPKARGDQRCPTRRCVDHCANVQLQQRLLGRDGSALCSVTAHTNRYQSLLVANTDWITDTGSSRDAPPILGSATDQNPPTLDLAPHIELALPPVPDNPSPPASPESPTPNRRIPHPVTPPAAPPPPKIEVSKQRGTYAIPIRDNMADLTSPDEIVRQAKASVRMGRENAQASLNNQVILTCWSKENKGSKFNFAIPFQPGAGSALVLTANSEVQNVLKDMMGPMVTYYNTEMRKWISTTWSTPLNIAGHRMLLLRTLGMSDMDCEGLEEELAILLGQDSSKTSSSSSLKRKANTLLEPVSSKANHTMTTSRIPPSQPPLSATQISTTKSRQPAEANAKSRRPTEANDCTGPFYELDVGTVAQKMKEIHERHWRNKISVKQAYEEAFGLRYVKSQWKRRRDDWFRTDQSIREEWETRHADRLFGAFANQVATPKGPKNDWIPPDIEASDDGEDDKFKGEVIKENHDWENLSTDDEEEFLKSSQRDHPRSTRLTTSSYLTSASTMLKVEPQAVQHFVDDLGPVEAAKAFGCPFCDGLFPQKPSEYLQNRLQYSAGLWSTGNPTSDHPNRRSGIAPSLVQLVCSLHTQEYIEEQEQAMAKASKGKTSLRILETQKAGQAAWQKPVTTTVKIKTEPVDRALPKPKRIPIIDLEAEVIDLEDSD